MWIILGIFSALLLGFHPRKASAVLVFAAGALYFRETSLRKRGIVLTGILAGVALVVLGSM